MQRHITILDSTLRDGAQGEGISFSVEDKIGIVRALDELGIAYLAVSYTHLTLPTIYSV